MKKITLIAAAALLCMAAQAQLLPIHNEMYFLRMLSNPALTAYNGSTNAYGYYRDQLTRATLHPRQGGAVAEISLWGDRIGTGVQVSSYTGGISQLIEAKLYYAQKIRLAEHHRLSLGITGGIIQGGLRIGDEYIRDEGDPEANERKALLFDMNIGLAYQWKKLTLGFAIPNLLDARGRVYTGTTQLTGFRRNYLINASYEISLKDETYNLEPAVLLKIDELKQVKFGANVMFNYKKIAYAGIGYRLYAGVPITAGVRISKAVTLAYTYEVPVIKGVSFAQVKGSHEVVLGVHFDRWIKKGDKAKDQAAAPQQSDYDSLLNRKASVDSLTATQQAVDSLAQKLEALQQALDNAQQQATEAAAQKSEQEAALAAQRKEQEAKLEALNKQIEDRAQQQQQEKIKQQAEQATQEETAPVAQKQTTTPVKTQPLAPEAKSFAGETENKKAPVAGDRFRLEQVSFERNGSELNAESYSQLDKLVAYLKAHPAIRVRVSGHTDSKANESYNGWLSRLRARAVAEYLKSKGISPNRIEAIGMGPNMPVGDNQTEEGRAKNRRVEVEFLK